MDDLGAVIIIFASTMFLKNSRIEFYSHPYARRPIVLYGLSYLTLECI